MSHIDLHITIMGCILVVLLVALHVSPAVLLLVPLTMQFPLITRALDTKPVSARARYILANEAGVLVLYLVGLVLRSLL